MEKRADSLLIAESIYGPVQVIIALPTNAKGPSSYTYVFHDPKNVKRSDFVHGIEYVMSFWKFATSYSQFYESWQKPSSPIN